MQSNRHNTHVFNSHSGMSLMNVIMLLFLVGVLTTAGVKMMGPLVQRGKINDTKTTVNSAVDAIISWSVANGRLPTATELQANNILANPNDAWGKPLVYAYDSNLTATATGGLCGRTTATSYNGQQVAFIIVSGGDDYTVTSLPASSQAFSGSPTVATSDLSRVISLDELKAKAGCFGKTGGRLQIVNNELPTACFGINYTATLYATGGVPSNGNYFWAIQNRPSWLTPSSFDYPTWSGELASVTLGGKPDSVGLINTILFNLKDSNNNTVQRNLLLNTKITGACASLCNADPSCPTNCYNNVVCRASCSSDPACKAACPGCVGSYTPGTPDNPIVFTPPTPGVVTDNWNGGTPADQGTNNTESPGGKFNMTVVDGTLSAISIQNGTTANCIWFQRPLTLTGKKLRAYLKFVFEQGTGFAVAVVPAATGQTTISSCDENSRLGVGPDIPGTPILGAEFLVNDWNAGTGPGSNCIAVNEEVCTASGAGINSWATGTTTYYVRIELDATATPNPTFKVWITSNAAHQTAMKNLSTAYPDTGLPADTKLVSKALTSIMSNFFLGFTTGQQGNDRVKMTLSDLKFELH